jgi:hypothetical protein
VSCSFYEVTASGQWRCSHHRVNRRPALGCVRLLRFLAGPRVTQGPLVGRREKFPNPTLPLISEGQEAQMGSDICGLPPTNVSHGRCGEQGDHWQTQSTSGDCCKRDSANPKEAASGPTLRDSAAWVPGKPKIKLWGNPAWIQGSDLLRESILNAKRLAQRPARRPGSIPRNQGGP